MSSTKNTQNSNKQNKNNELINNTSIEQQYKKKTLHEHILDLPDSYIGSIQNDLINLYWYDEQENKIIRKDIHIVLGLYKIFDEILVNAADNTVRDKKCNKIEVNINQELGEISVKNNGSTIPIEIHKKENSNQGEPQPNTPTPEKRKVKLRNVWEEKFQEPGK